LPVDDVPLREETAPIHDIRVTFHPRYAFSRIHVEPRAGSGSQQDVRGTVVVVPRLDVHSMVVAELSPAAAQ